MSILVFFHIVAGSVAIISGCIAPFTRKGGKAHKLTGLAFLAGILVLGLSGALVAWIRDVPLSFLNGLLISYFVVTSYNVIKHQPDSINLLDKIMALFAVMLTGAFIYYASKAANALGGELGGFGPEAFIAFGSVALICALSDIRFVLKGGLAGKQRLIRHLWRMFFALLMSTAAFFLGQSALFPEFMQKIELLLLPVALVLCNLLFWLGWVSIKSRG